MCWWNGFLGGCLLDEGGFGVVVVEECYDGKEDEEGYCCFLYGCDDALGVFFGGWDAMLLWCGG